MAEGGEFIDADCSCIYRWRVEIPKGIKLYYAHQECVKREVGCIISGCGPRMATGTSYRQSPTRAECHLPRSPSEHENASFLQRRIRFYNHFKVTVEDNHKHMFVLTI